MNRTQTHARALALGLTVTVALSAGMLTAGVSPALAVKTASSTVKVWDARTGLDGKPFGGKVYASAWSSFGIGAPTRMTATINPLSAAKSYIAKKYPASPAKSGYPRFETSVTAHQKPYATGAWSTLGTCEAIGDTSKSCTAGTVTRPAVVLMKVDSRLITWSSGKEKTIAATHKEWLAIVTLPSAPLGIPTVTQEPAALKIPTNTESVTYSSRGTVAAGNTVYVYAAIRPGYDRPAVLPAGWAKAPAGSPGQFVYSASFTKPVVLGKPVVRQADGMKQRAALRLPPAGPGVRYMQVGTVKPGQTATVVARLLPGYGVHGAPPAGWRLNADGSYSYPAKFTQLKTFGRAKVTIRPKLHGQSVRFTARVKIRPAKGSRISYRWHVGKKPVKGKAGHRATLVTTRSMIGKRVHVKVTVTKRWYQGKKIRSNSLMRLS